MTTIELTSTGSLSQLLQRHPTEIRRVCEELGIQPSYRLYAVAYYDVAACQRLLRYFREKEQSI